jgi:ankyrin repeat protein
MLTAEGGNLVAMRGLLSIADRASERLGMDALDVDDHSAFGVTAVFYAVRCPDAAAACEALRLLKAHGANVNFQARRDGECATMVHGSLSSATGRRLMAYVMFQWLPGATALMNAARLGRLEVAKCLLDMGAHPDLRCV